MKYLYLKVFVAVFMLAVAAFSQTDNERQAIILNDQGVAHYKQGDFQQAIKSLDRAAELVSNNPVFHINRGHVYRELNDLTRAEAAFRKALELQPQHAITHNQLGIVLMEAHRDKEALTAFRAGLAITPDDPVILLNTDDTDEKGFHGLILIMKICVHPFNPCLPAGRRVIRIPGLKNQVLLLLYLF